MGACGSDCGITRVRAAERQAALAVAERAHPGLVWSKARSLSPAIPFDTVVSLARHLEELLPVRAIVRTSGAGASCFIALLAGLHEPSLVEIADGGFSSPSGAIPTSEVYLRVTFSPWGRFVTIQEVVVQARATTVDV